MVSDPTGLKRGLNTFLYLMCNPVVYSDPSGLYVVEFTANGPVTASDTGDTRYSEGEKWCSYTYKQVGTGEQKDTNPAQALATTAASVSKMVTALSH